MKATTDWTLKDWLEVCAYIAAIVGGIAGGSIFLANAREDAISNSRAALVQHWTNEGDVSSNEKKFIDLALENIDGDVIGTLTSPKLTTPLDVHVDIGWFSSKLTVKQLQARTVSTVATIRLKITGNQNRLSWSVISSSLPDYLPQSTTLWPHPVASNDS